MQGDVVEQHLELVLGADHVHDLAHGVRGVVLALDLGLDGLLHPLGGEAHHVVGERSGVEHRGALVLLRQVRHDATHVGDEAHVEHAVRLVDDERVHAVEVHDVTLAEVQQTPGRRHEQVHGGLLQLLALAVHVHAAVDGE